jgi:hypothetical protein
VPAVAGDAPTRVIGMGTAADADRLTWHEPGPPPTFHDGRFVLVRPSGVTQLRDAATGGLIRSVQSAAVDPDTMVAYDGWLYGRGGSTSGASAVYATDLVNGTPDAVVTVTMDHFVQLAACGTRRVCIVTEHQPKDGAATTAVTAYDVVRHTRIWQTRSKMFGEVISSAHGWTMLSPTDVAGFELFDAKGHVDFMATLAGGWLDDKTLLVAAPDGTGRVSRWSVAEKKLTPLGDPFGEILMGCTSTSDRLVCATETELKIWRVR